MSKMKIDLTNFRESVSGHVPPGEYELLITSVSQTTAKKSGNDMLVVHMEIVNNQQAKYNGITIIDRLTLTEKALFKVVGLLRGLGYKTPRGQISVDPEQWVNRRVMANIIDNEWDGRVNSAVDTYFPYVAPVASNASTLVDDEAEGEEVAEPEEVVTSAEEVAETTTTTAKPDIVSEPGDDEAEDDVVDLDDIEL